MPTEVVTTEVVERNWLQRQGGACQNMCCGFFVVAVCVSVVFWNETNYVREMATADEVQGAVEIADCRARPEDKGSLVFVTNCMATQPDLAPAAPNVLRAFMPDGYEGASLRWKLEIMQWEKECHTTQNCEKTNTGGERCVKTKKCSDERGWKSRPIDSSELQSEENSGELPSNVKDGSLSAPSGSVFLSAEMGNADAAFWADEPLLEQFPSGPVALKSAPGHVAGSWQSQNASGPLSPEMLRISDSGVLQTGSEIGDVRITLTGRRAKHPSVAAMQVLRAGTLNATFAAYPPQPFNFWGQTTKPLERLVDSPMSREAFVEQYKQENTTMVWIVRVIGFVVMVMAFRCIFAPLSVAADLLRFLNYCTCFLGTLLDNASQCVINTVSFAFACSCFSLVFTLAWFTAHPTYAVCGMVVIFGFVGAMVFLQRTRKRADGRDLSLPLVDVQQPPPKQQFEVGSAQ